MNKRIREILGQCQHESIDGPEYSRWTDLEKFAELIIKECEEVLRLVPYNSDRDFGDEAIYQEAIAKHFRS